jgi:glycine hydroxymethyltransferase
VRLTFEPNGIDLDLEAVERDMLRYEPALVFVGTQAMLFPLDLRALRQIADRTGTTIVYDAAHPLGLIAGDRFQDPLGEGADLITASTQKSLPGPVGGIVIAGSAELMAPIYEASNHLLSNYQNNRVLSLGYTLLEMAHFGAGYARACVDNAQTLAAELAAAGVDPLFPERGFTQSNHVLLSWGTKTAADEYALRFEAADVIVSTIRLPSGDPANAVFGTRLGVQDVTRHGMGRAEMAEVASLLAAIARDEHVQATKARTTDLASAFSQVRYCFEAGQPEPG